jgi:hypothetical protein
VGRAEEVCKGATREIAARWARLSLLCNPLKGHYPRKESKHNKRRSGFPARVFTQNLVCNVVGL